MSQPVSPDNSYVSKVKTEIENRGKKGSMLGRPILFLDLETTGLNPGQHEITEVGALLVSQPDYKTIATYQSKVMPVHLETATPEALQIGHFDLASWTREAKSLETAMSELAEVGRDAILAGFNLTFDWAFLQMAFNQCKLEDPFYYHRFDVMSSAFTMLYNQPGLKKFSLREMCQFFGLTNKAAHTAYGDAEATFEVFLGLMRFRPGDGPAVKQTRPTMPGEDVIEQPTTPEV